MDKLNINQWAEEDRPSGNPHPSNEDLRLTQMVHNGAQTMSIRPTDHAIITDGKHYSFADEGLLE